MNWLTYLLNEFFTDVVDAQEKGKFFSYSWLLILISVVAWDELPHYQGVDVLMPCRGVQYQNLWYDKDNVRQQKDNNVEFYLHGEH